MINYLYKAVYALFILALVAVAGLFLATMLPIPGTIEIKIVKSGSMEPAIPTGSIVAIMPATTYALGDIVTFGRDTAREIPTTHRIVEVQGGGVTFLTKGDANEEADPRPIVASEVIGKVWFAVPFVGYILDFARQPLGFTFMIGVPAAFIIVDELIRLVREIQRIYRRRERSIIGEVQRAPARSASASVPLRSRLSAPRYFDIPPPHHEA